MSHRIFVDTATFSIRSLKSLTKEELSRWQTEFPRHYKGQSVTLPSHVNRQLPMKIWDLLGACGRTGIFQEFQLWTTQEGTAGLLIGISDGNTYLLAEWRAETKWGRAASARPRTVRNLRDAGFVAATVFTAVFLALSRVETETIILTTVTASSFAFLALPISFFVLERRRGGIFSWLRR